MLDPTKTPNLIADFSAKDSDVISDYNNKFCYYFYIRNISKNFDVDLLDYHFEDDHSLTVSEDDRKDLENFNSLTKSSVVVNIINATFNKMAALTTTDVGGLFLKLKENENHIPMYVTYDKENDFSKQILGNVHTNKMYSFISKVNPNSFLYRFADSLRVMFYLQQDTNRIVGGFVLNKLDSDSENFDDTLNDYYVTNLINSFIVDQLYPFDIELLLSANGASSEVLTMQNPNLKLLKQNWEKLITSKYIKYKNLDDLEKKYFLDDLFYSFMSTFIVVVSVVEEIDDYFTSGQEKAMISDSQKAVESDYKQCLDESCKLNCEKIFLALCNSLRKDKIGSLKRKQFDNYSLSEPKLIFDVYTEKPIYLLNNQSILNNRILVGFLMMILFREDYGINDINSNLLNIKQFKQLLIDDVHNGFNKNQEEKFLSTICAQNFDYASFISENQIVILHNYVDPNTENKYAKIVNYYTWAMVYVVSKELERDDLTVHANYIMSSNQKSKVVFFRQLLRDIDDIKFSWDDDFFGVKQIKTILKTVDKQVKLVDSLNDLMARIKTEDEVYKRQTERTSIILSFIVALLIGYVDFLACVFSIIPCSSGSTPWNWILGTIGFTTCTTSINMIILVCTIVYLGKLRFRYKWIDVRAKRVLYNTSRKPQFIKSSAK